MGLKMGLKCKYQRPFSEWRIPVMIVLMSSIFFVMITAMFGVVVDGRSGGVIFNMDGMMDEPNDQWLSNPMGQYPDWCYLAMIIGYYFAIGILIIGWFDYCKWKWNSIPIEYRFEERKLKAIDNKRDYIESLK